jgi:hypothetical protein
MACGREKGVGADQKCTDPLLDKSGKGRRNFAFGAAIENEHSHPKDMGGDCTQYNTATGNPGNLPALYNLKLPRWVGINDTILPRVWTRLS